MAEQWHYSRGGKQAGPVSASDLKQLASSGQLSPTDQVWKAGMANWVPAAKVKGLFAAPTASAPPPTPSHLPPSTPLHPAAPDDDKKHPLASGSGYVDSNLTAGEKVVYRARLHWIVFVSLRAILTLWIAPLIDWFTSEFAVTNKRIIIKVGLISRKTLEMNLARVESVNVDQGIFGRILGYGCVTVIGTGGTREPFHGISDPLQFRRAFQQLQA